MSDADASGAETPGQRAARLRREKRQNKTNAEERLAKIKSLNGGIAPPEEALGGPSATQASGTENDPDVADISNTNYGSPKPTNTAGGPAPTNDQLYRDLLRMQAQQATRQPRDSPRQNDSRPSDEDPMVQMMQQFMSTAGGQPGDPNNVHNTQDPMQMLSALMGAQGQGNAQSKTQSTSSYTYVWRVVHSIFAIVIAGYIAATSTFDGSLLARTQSTYNAESSSLGHRLFIVFMTAELVLQSTRFFIERGQLQGSGVLASISQVAPEPWAGYVRAAGRWISILGSIFSDAMVVIFVLGLLAWWNGTTAS